MSAGDKKAKDDHKKDKKDDRKVRKEGVEGEGCSSFFSFLLQLLICFHLRS